MLLKKCAQAILGKADPKISAVKATLPYHTKQIYSVLILLLTSYSIHIWDIPPIFESHVSFTTLHATSGLYPGITLRVQEMKGITRVTRVTRTVIMWNYCLELLFMGLKTVKGHFPV